MGISKLAFSISRRRKLRRRGEMSDLPKGFAGHQELKFLIKTN